MSSISVSVKWNGKKYDNTSIELDNSVLDFKMTLFKLTNVPIDRQKIIVKGSVLKSNTELIKNIPGMSNGASILMMGSIDNNPQLIQPQAVPQFIEDLSEKELSKVQKIPSGLTNLGNTCFLNSTIQSLRAIPELQAALNTATTNEGTQSRKPVDLALSLRDLYNALNRAAGEEFNPIVFYQIFKITYPHLAQIGPSGVPMQQDAEEAWTCLLSSLRANAQVSKFIDDLMTGTFTNTLILNNSAEETSITTEPFTKLSCHISQETTNLSIGIAASLTEQISKNSRATGHLASFTKTSTISSLPRYLTVQFIRFDWKSASQVKAKILKKVKFSLELDLYQHCTKELQKELDPIRATLLEKSGNASGLSSSKPHSGLYELIAVLTHVGRTADSGHYISWVRKDAIDASLPSQTGWWKFDDEEVSSVADEDILKLDGGGDWHSAYMILYREK